MPTLILDNGAGSIKFGYSDQVEPTLYPNLTAKVKKSMQYLVSEQVTQYQNGALLEFTRPFERGYLTNWQSEIEVWSHLFQNAKCSPQETALVVTEPLLNLYSIQSDMNEIVFEYFGFKEYVRRPAAWFSANKCMNYQQYDIENLSGCVIVDSGFSFTHIAPFIDGKCQRNAIKRINVGGKLLTNYLKELVSYRQWNMMDEFMLINQVKEQLCYVSNNVIEELRPAKGKSRNFAANTIKDIFNGKLRKNFVLPDFYHIMKGYVKNDDDPITKEEQLLAMETERFSVPEILFSPGDIGMNQAGVAEATWQSLSMLRNEIDIFKATSKILLTGGNVKFPNFKSRYEKDVRPFIPDIYRVNVFEAENPELYAWQAAKEFVDNVPRDIPVDMQRIVERIQKEFSSSSSYLEITALDGNGDSFKVYQGSPQELVGYSFSNILRDPGCFYFFNITCLPDLDQPEHVQRRDLCWLTDPFPPTAETITSNNMVVRWDPVRFCGIANPNMINSITYTLEVSEGVDWKETAMSRFINDNIASSYKVMFRGKNASSAFLENLKPAKWYHVRLIIDYLGLRVMSESSSFHTLRSPPSAPGIPRVTVIPVQNAFDASSPVPARLDMNISWNTSIENGFPIERYQVHVKRFDIHGKVLIDDPPTLRKKLQAMQPNSQKVIGILVKSSKQSNQWIASPGKSETQIRNSLNSRSGRRSRSPSPSGRARSPEQQLQTFSNSGLNSTSQFDSQILQGNKRPQTWKIVHDNLNRSVRLFAPKEGDGEWWIRVRAKNAEGWSNFSALFIINHYNYPSLFPKAMLKEAESQDEYYEYFYSSNNNMSRSNDPVQYKGEKPESPHRSQFGNNNPLPPVRVASNASRGEEEFLLRSSKSGRVDENDSSQGGSVQFRNHHYEHFDSLKNHQDEVGLFWDHKAIVNPAPAPAPASDLQIQISGSNDDLLPFEDDLNNDLIPLVDRSFTRSFSHDSQRSPQHRGNNSSLERSILPEIHRK